MSKELQLLQQWFECSGLILNNNGINCQKRQTDTASNNKQKVCCCWQCPSVVSDSWCRYY